MANFSSRFISRLVISFVFSLQCSQFFLYYPRLFHALSTKSQYPCTALRCHQYFTLLFCLFKKLLFFMPSQSTLFSPQMQNHIYISYLPVSPLQAGLHRNVSPLFGQGLLLPFPLRKLLFYD